MRHLSGPLVALLLVPAALAAQEPDRVRAAILAAAVERLGEVTSIDVAIDQGRADLDAVSAAPVTGARLGRPSAFTVVTRDGRSTRVVATVRASALHGIARRAVIRDTPMTEDDVDWRDESLDGAAFVRLPAREEVIGARSRRTLAPGERLTRATLVREPDVKAGEAVTITLRTGTIEAVGSGRAASSGFVGDIIRVLRPGSRTTQRARVISPAAVEILP